LNRELLTILICPSCRSELALAGEEAVNRTIESGFLRCRGCLREYPITRGVPRFVPQENYAGHFGYQWNRFPRTQLDSFSGKPMTRTRFFDSVGWKPLDMSDRWVLDVGCGSGRFAEVAVRTGARVVAIDYSAAVDAAQANLGSSGRIDIVQADIYALPFREASFDFVYCLGVLQYTPDVRRAFLALPRNLKEWRTPGRRPLSEALDEYLLAEILAAADHETDGQRDAVPAGRADDATPSADQSDYRAYPAPRKMAALPRAGGRL
jgi:SAM-dependent methyltransferase